MSDEGKSTGRVMADEPRRWIVWVNEDGRIANEGDDSDAESIKRLRKWAELERVEVVEAKKPAEEDGRT